MAFFYDYLCEANGKTVQVRHSSRVRLKTWGEVCENAGVDAGKTPLDAPVIRMVGGTPYTPKLEGLDKDDYGTSLRF